jgi:hypothetical protein
VNILNKQSLTADKGRSSSGGGGEVGHGSNNSSPERNKPVMKCRKDPQAWTDSLDK